MPGRVWEEGGPIWIPNVAESQNLPRKAVLLKYGLHALFGFPVYAEGRLQAVLEFFSTAKQPPDEQLLRVVQSIRQQLGRVLERRRANEQQEDAFERAKSSGGHTLAVIQSMFRRSAQHAASMKQLEDAFSGCLMNLSAVYKLLSESESQFRFGDTTGHRRKPAICNPADISQTPDQVGSCEADRVGFSVGSESAFVPC